MGLWTWIGAFGRGKGKHGKGAGKGKRGQHRLQDNDKDKDKNKEVWKAQSLLEGLLEQEGSDQQRLFQRIGKEQETQRMLTIST